MCDVEHDCWRERDLSPCAQRRVPWGRLLRCWRFYPSIVGELASSWVANLTTTQGPTFLKTQVLCCSVAAALFTVPVFGGCKVAVHTCVGHVCTFHSLTDLTSAVIFKTFCNDQHAGHRIMSCFPDRLA